MRFKFFMIGFSILCGIIYTHEKTKSEFNKCESVLIECTLVERSYFPENRRFSEKFITIWNCDQYGVLMCYDRDLYAKAKQKTFLYIKSNKQKTAIVGFEFLDCSFVLIDIR